jgi:hypothetical protein
MNNFSAAFAIFSAMCSAPILRLKETWGLVSDKTMGINNNLAVLLNNSSNYQTYRRAIQQIRGACIPYLGMFLQDLTFIEDGNPTFINDNPELINLSKFQLVGMVLDRLLSFQTRHSYSYSVTEDLRFHLLNAETYDPVCSALRSSLFSSFLLSVPLPSLTFDLNFQEKMYNESLISEERKKAGGSTINNGSPGPRSSTSTGNVANGGEGGKEGGNSGGTNNSRLGKRESMNFTKKTLGLTDNSNSIKVKSPRTQSCNNLKLVQELDNVLKKRPPGTSLAPSVHQAHSSNSSPTLNFKSQQQHQQQQQQQPSPMVALRKTSLGGSIRELQQQKQLIDSAKQQQQQQQQQSQSGETQVAKQQ